MPGFSSLKRPKTTYKQLVVVPKSLGCEQRNRYLSLLDAAFQAKLEQLCRNLETVYRGQHAAPPSCCHTGPNGRFLFRAYWLNGQNHESGGLVGMIIEHQEPLVLKILRTLQNLPLSPSQKEVALLLAQGASSEKIGERLHIKPSTVKDRIRKIFNKLDIHHRDELLPKLLAGENEQLIQLHR
jgi:DNA-binding CsgD family transcriptional regulator